MWKIGQFEISVSPTCVGKQQRITVYVENPNAPDYVQWHDRVAQIDLNEHSARLLGYALIQAADYQHAKENPSV